MVNLGAGDADAHADVDFDADGDYAYSPGEASECLPLDYEDFDSEDECPLAYLPPACDPSTHPQSHGETEEAGESAHQRTNPQPMPGGTNPQPMPRSTNPQPMPRGGNEEVGEDGRMFTVLRGSGGKVYYFIVLSNSNTHLASGTLKFRMSGEDLTDTLKCNSIFYKFSFEFVRLFCL